MVSPGIVSKTLKSREPLDGSPAVTNGGLSNVSDAQLIAEVLSGRSELFSSLLEPHLPTLLRFVRARIRDDAEAEDVIQQTLLKAFTKLQQFRHEASFRTWLSQIAVNEVRQLQRKRLSSVIISLDQNSFLQFADSAASPFEECERHERITSLQRALPKLPEDYRILIRLRDLQQLSIAETAGLLQLSIPTVKSRHHQARLRMARLLAPIRPAVIHGDVGHTSPTYLAARP